MDTTRYMVVERFRGGNARAVYERLRALGRQTVPGLTHVASWVTDDLTACFQVMEAADRRLLEEWMATWSDLVAFEVSTVIESSEAERRALGG